MKASTLLLGASLVANLALGAVWFWRGSAPAAPSPATAPVAAPKPAAPAPPAITPETWRDLGSGSDADYVARLRAEGFPPRVVALLVYARLRERHAEAFKKFEPKGVYAYWRRSLSNPYGMPDDLTPEQRAERRALNRQVDEEARGLLGEDLEQMDLAVRAERKRTYGDLSQAKADQLSAINRDYSELSTMVRDRMQGITLPEDREQLAALETEKRADLAALLTPAELLEYDLRASQSARIVQSRLRNFDATEEEYRAITTLQMAFDKTYGGTNPSGAQQQQRTAAQAELNEQIKALMTPERYADYEVKTDSTYTSMAYLFAQFNPSGDTVAAVRAQKDFATRYNALRNDRTLAPDVRNAQLDALAGEARTRMSEVLGSAAYEAFRNNGGPINSLVNRKVGKP